MLVTIVSVALGGSLAGIINYYVFRRIFKKEREATLQELMKTTEWKQVSDIINKVHETVNSGTAEKLTDLLTKIFNFISTRFGDEEDSEELELISPDQM